MVSAPIEPWKLRCITRLADYQSLHGPTDSAEEALFLSQSYWALSQNYCARLTAESYPRHWVVAF
jgi:hypothetical protein